MMRILVVEEELVVSKALAKILFWHFKGLEIDAVFSAEEAVTKIEQSQCYDLIITDYIMSGQNGLWLIAWLCEQKITTKVIIMSGGLSQVPEDAVFLRKPFGIKEVVKALEAHGIKKEAQ